LRMDHSPRSRPSTAAGHPRSRAHRRNPLSFRASRERDVARRAVARLAWRARPTRPHRRYQVLEASQWWSPERLRGVQLEALRKVLAAARTVPFYERRLREAGIDASRLGALEDLRALPPLERSELQEHGIRGLRVPGARGIALRSSGSTGRPVEVLWPLARRAWSDAMDRRTQAWLGARFGGRRVHLRSNASFKTPRARLNAILLNKTLVDAASLSDEDSTRALFASLERRPPETLEGVSNALYSLALASAAAHQQMRSRVCVSGGNHLFDHYRSSIETAFGCTAYQRYSTWETGLIAHECTEGRSLHVMAETTLVEVVGPDSAGGEPGTVLITDLRNRAMPLLRYRVGDLAQGIDCEPCPCGRGLPVLRNLAGRSNELLRRADGGSVVPNVVSRIMTDARVSVVEFQVTQSTDGSLLARLVQRDEPDPEHYRSAIAASLRTVMGPGVRVQVERVDRLALTPGGKLRHIFSAID
jgi:phenylacetate-CoA ligase